MWTAYFERDSTSLVVCDCTGNESKWKTLLLVLQWALSLVAIVAYWNPLFHAFKEFGLWGLVFLLVPPLLIFFYIPTPLEGVPIGGPGPYHLSLP